MNNNLTIELKACPDKFGKTYYVGKLDTPVLIDASKGITFLIFTSEEGAEQLQIAHMDKRPTPRKVNLE